MCWPQRRQAEPPRCSMLAAGWQQAAQTQHTHRVCSSRPKTPGESANAVPHYHKLCSRVSHIWGNRRGQHIRSAMDKPRPGKTTFVIMVSPLPGKYEFNTPPTRTTPTHTRSSLPVTAPTHLLTTATSTAPTPALASTPNPSPRCASRPALAQAARDASPCGPTSCLCATQNLHATRPSVTSAASAPPISRPAPRRLFPLTHPPAWQSWGTGSQGPALTAPPCSRKLRQPALPCPGAAGLAAVPSPLQRARPPPRPQRLRSLLAA